MKTQTKPLEILVFGTGAVGAVFGAKAQTSRSRITAVCRGNHEVARTKGFSIQSPFWGDSLFRPNRIVRSPSEVSEIVFDYVVLATKTSSNKSALEALRPVISEKTTLVSVQNGIASETFLSEAFSSPIISATCYVNCNQPRPGTVEHISQLRPHAFYLGLHTPGQNGRGLEELDALVSLSSTFTKVEDARQERWRKMMMNTTWSLSTSILNKNTREVLQDPQGCRIATGLAEEALRVGLAMGINLDESLPSAIIDTARQSSAIVPSMLQDIRSGQPIEVEALCGDVLRLGEKHGIRTPILESIYAFLSDINSRLEHRQALLKRLQTETANFMPMASVEHTSPPLRQQEASVL